MELSSGELLAKEGLETFFVEDDNLIRLDIDEVQIFELMQLAGHGFSDRTDSLRDLFTGKRDVEHPVLGSRHTFLGLHIQKKFDQTRAGILQGEIFDERAEAAKFLGEEVVEAVGKLRVRLNQFEVVEA